MQSNYLLSLITSLLSVIVNSDGHIDFQFLTRFDDLNGDSGTAESCLYDPINGLWRFWDRNMNGEADSLSGNYPFTGTEYFVQGREGAGNETSGGVAGTVFVSNAYGNFVYIADIQSGEIYQYNVDTEELGEELDTGFGFGANGLCYDQENNMLYATNVGIDFFGTFGEANAALPNKSSIVRFALDDAMPIAETVYESGNELENYEGEVVKETYEPYINVTGENYTFRPNGCTIKDGMAYFIETRTDGAGGFLIYDIAENQFVLNTATPGYPGDGLVTVGNYLIMSSWGAGGDTGFLSYYDLDTYPDGTFTVLDNDGNTLNSPADIGVDPYGTICIPSLVTGYLYFYKFSAPGAGYRVLDKQFDFASAVVGDFAFGYSVDYDEVNDAYIFINNFGTVSYIPDVAEISASATLNEDDSGFGYESIDFLDEDSSVIDASKYDGASAFYWGISSVDDRLFLADLFGLFVEGDLENKTVRNFVEVLPEGASYFAAGLRGVCNDPDNSNIFYITSTAGYIFSVDVSNDTVELDDNGEFLETSNWEVNIVYDGSEINDQNDANSKVFYPFDCTVTNGKVYLVEYSDASNALVTNPGLGIYDIDSEEFTYNTDLFSYPTAGISSSGDTLVIGLFTPPAVLVSTVNDNGKRNPFQMIASGDSFPNIDKVFYVVVDYKNGVIVINGQNADTENGYFSFIQSDDLILSDEPEISSTEGPESTDEPGSTESTDVLVSGSTESDDSGDGDGNADSTNALSTIFSIAFVFIFYLF